MKYFITGATGFVGRHLVRRLLNKGRHTLYCLVRDERKLPGDIRSRVKVLQGNGESLERHRAAIQACEIVVHLAARASLGDGSAYTSDNIAFTESLVRIAQSSKKLRRFVFTSTIGAVDRTPRDSCNHPLTEDSVPHPMSDYGKSKLECERLLLGSKLPYVILRPALVYGPGMRRQSHLRVFIESVARGSLTAKFDFPGKVSLIHIDDLVEALLIVARHHHAAGQTYFAADDEPIALGEIFKQLGGILGRKAGTIQVDLMLPQLFRALRRYLPFRAQNLFSDVLTASNKKLRALGFAPKKNRVDGFLETAHDHFSKEQREQGTAIVTGGASGIGKSLCEQLYTRGYSIILLDRDRVQGRRVAKSVHGKFLYADLGNITHLRRIVRILKGRAEHISLLVNNAGIGARGNVGEFSNDKLSALLAVNCEAPVMLTELLLPSFIKRGHGCIINIGSSAGYQPLPYMSAYAASKAFVIRYTQGLQGELRGQNIPKAVEVLLASPSGTATNFQRASGVKGEDEARLLKPQAVAAAIVRRIGKGSASFIIGSSGTAMAIAARLLPTHLQIRLWERLMRTMR